MIAEYFIYRRKGDKEPFISLGEMPQYRLRPKQKFTGKKLKIEVIRRLSGVEIEQTATTPQTSKLGHEMTNTQSKIGKFKVHGNGRKVLHLTYWDFIRILEAENNVLYRTLSAFQE